MNRNLNGSLSSSGILMYSPVRNFMEVEKKPQRNLAAGGAGVKWVEKEAISGQFS